jgi:hypothetical protein
MGCTYFEILFLYLPGDTKKNHGNLRMTGYTLIIRVLKKFFVITESVGSSQSHVIAI